MVKKILLVFLVLLFYGCKEAVTVDTSVNSKVVEPVYPYQNEKYAFALKSFPADFEVEKLDNDAGIIFKKWVEPPKSENLKDPSFDYEVEIYLMPFQNIEDYEKLSDFVGEKYAGYTFEFADYGEFSGYYVNEGMAANAVSHFYTMGRGEETIYELYLKVPGKYHAAQKAVFEALVKGLVFF